MAGLIQKTKRLFVLAVICCPFLQGCEPPSDCVDRACVTAEVAMQETCVLIAYGYYDPAPLETPGRPHVQCMRWWNGRWEFCCMDGDETQSMGTEIYGFEVKRYYMYHEFIAEKEKLERDDIG